MPHLLLEADKGLSVCGLKAQLKRQNSVSDSHETAKNIVFSGVCQIFEDPAHRNFYEGLRLLIVKERVAVGVCHC